SDSNQQQAASVQIGRDRSVAVMNADGEIIDRYQGSDPNDILRWVKSKGYATPDVRFEVVSSAHDSKPVSQAEPIKQGDSTTSPVSEETAPARLQQIAISGRTILVRHKLTPEQAAIANYSVNAE